MTTTVEPLAPPDPHRCPVCAAAVATARCAACGVDLGGAAGRELWAVDEQLARLSRRRLELLDLLRAPATPPPGVPLSQLPPPPPGPAAPGTPVLPAPPAPSAQAPPAPGPEVSTVLLWLGVTLLVVAALVFAAVSWNRLGALGQGLLLVGLTVAAGAGARGAARRGLSGTAEALGVLAVVMGPLVAQAVRITLDLPDIDDRSWANLAVWSWWPGAILVIGLAAIAFGRSIGIRSASAIGVVLVQVAPAIWIALAPLAPAATAWALASQAALVAVVIAPTERERPTLVLWAWGTATAWLLAFLVAVDEAGSSGGSIAVRAAATSALAGCGLAAGVTATRWRDRTAVADVATAAAATAAAFATGRALAGSVPEIAWWPIMGTVAAAGLVVADRARGLRSGAVRLVSSFTAGVSALPLVAHAVSVLAAAGALDEPWHRTPAGRVTVDTVTQLDPAWLSALLGVAALGAVLAAVGQRLTRPTVVSAVAALATVAVALALPLAGASLGLVTAGTLAATLGLAAAAPGGHERLLAAASLATLWLALVWAIGSLPLVLVVGAVAATVGAVAVLRSIETDDVTLAVGGTALTAVALVAEAGVAGSALGATPAWSFAVASASAAVLAVVLATVLPPGGHGPSTLRSARSVVAPTAGAVLLTAHVWTVMSIGATSAPAAAPTTVALVFGVIALAVIAVRLHGTSGSWWLIAMASATEALALLWYRLAVAEVTTAEAFTVPLAALLGAAAWLVARGRDDDLASVRSWQLEGPALALALGPTALLALGDPGLTRQVSGLAIGAVLVVAGAAARRRAPIDVGAAAVVVLGLQALLPYAAEVPRWVSLGTVGAVLVLVGATFEERRRDLDQARQRYAALR